MEHGVANERVGVRVALSTKAVGGVTVVPARRAHAPLHRRRRRSRRLGGREENPTDAMVAVQRLLEV
jgi:hypothetical protein